MPFSHSLGDNKNNMANFFFFYKSFVTVSMFISSLGLKGHLYVSKPTGNIFKLRTCSAQSWVVLPLANNEMNWVLTNEQFTQSIHLKQRFLSAETVLPNKRKVTKARASLSFMETALSSGRAGASVSLSLC